MDDNMYITTYAKLASHYGIIRQQIVIFINANIQRIQLRTVVVGEIWLIHAF